MCRSSSLEITIRKLLVEHNITFEEQKTWDWLIYRGSQRVDFYLSEFNAVIECQGKQHFEENEFFDQTETLEERQRRDENKRKLCEEHGIKVFYYSNLRIEYPYFVYEDFENLINEIKRLV